MSALPYGIAELFAGAVLILGSCILADGQGQIQFDAATVKPDPLGQGGFGMKGGPGTNDPGRITWNKVSLQQLMAKAFDIDFRNVSGPSWISGLGGAQLYALTATMPPATSKHDFELMLQNFLIEQFRTKLHHEPSCFLRMTWL